MMSATTPGNPTTRSQTRYFIVTTILFNETEIGSGKVLCQTLWTYAEMGRLAEPSLIA
jgi:hypothetical protein